MVEWISHLALSATPQLHAPKRLEELMKIFEQIEVFSVDDPEIKRYVPDRVMVLVKVYAPSKLLNIYDQLGKVIQAYQRRIREIYGPEHMGKYCKEHGLCVWLLALKMLKFRLVEDEASSVLSYGTWKAKELRPIRFVVGARCCMGTVSSNTRFPSRSRPYTRRFQRAYAFSSPFSTPQPSLVRPMNGFGYSPFYLPKSSENQVR